jgi:hypothetical protein
MNNIQKPNICTNVPWSQILDLNYVSCFLQDSYFLQLYIRKKVYMALIKFDFLNMYERRAERKYWI